MLTISPRDFSILSRIARMVVNDHVGERVELAMQKLSSNEIREIGQNIINQEEDSPIAQQILKANRSLFLQEQ